MKEKNLIQITAELRAMGFDTDFWSEGDNLLRSRSGDVYAPDQMKIKEMYRLEGDSDPEEMCAVFGLENIEDPKVRGIFIEPFGPAMSAREVAVSQQLIDDRQQPA